jgi:hypothetical protein
MILVKIDHPYLRKGRHIIIDNYHAQGMKVFFHDGIVQIQF